MYVLYVGNRQQHLPLTFISSLNEQFRLYKDLGSILDQSGVKGDRIDWVRAEQAWEELAEAAAKKKMRRRREILAVRNSSN